MATFDQRKQKVKYQYNANGNINFRATQNDAEIVSELKKLQAELLKAIQLGGIEEETAVDAKYYMEKAVLQSQKDSPNKKKMLDSLETVKSLLGGLLTLSGLATGISEAIQAIQSLMN